jgi:predicted nucleotidyltransferase
MKPGNFSYFLPKLCQHGVEFILIGGGAAIVHGAARTTYDVDILYSRTPENLKKLITALDGIQLYYRGTPPGLPFRWDEKTLEQGLNFTLTSTQGDIDLLGEVAGGGTWESVQPFTENIEIFGVLVPVVCLAKLIELKRAAGRPKDFESIAELEAIRDETQPPP